MDFFKRLVNKNFHNEPVEYIFARIIIPTLEYDHLYENQNRFDGKIWSEFKKTYNLKCKFHDDLRDIELSKDVICLWFFRERADKDAGNDIKLARKIINYSSNGIFITTSNEIKIKERKKFFPRRPVVQIDIDSKTYLNIKKGLKIND